MARTSSIFMQSLVEIRRYTAAWERKVGSFCLFVTLWILNLNKGLAHQRFSHSNSDIVAICWSILMRMSAFFKGRNALSNIWKYIWTMARGGATFVLENWVKMNFSENSKGIVCAHDFDHGCSLNFRSGAWDYLERLTAGMTRYMSSRNLIGLTLHCT